MARNAEYVIQASIVAFIRAVLPSVIVFHVPNGGLRAKREAALLKWIGTVAGIPDLGLILPDGRSAWIEVKAPGGSLSPEQKAVHKALTDLGHPYAVCRSVDDVKAFFDHIDVRTREAA